MTVPPRRLTSGRAGRMRGDGPSTTFAESVRRAHGSDARTVPDDPAAAPAGSSATAAATVGLGLLIVLLAAPGATARLRRVRTRGASAQPLWRLERPG